MTRDFRQPRVTDLAAIMAIQRECYPPVLREDRLTIEERMAVAAEYCWVAEDEHGIAAYLFAYPSTLGKITPLDGAFRIAPDGDTLYFHDLAVLKRVAGTGLGSDLVDVALASAAAQGFAHAALVAVQESSMFWERMGYRRRDELDEVERENLQTYPGSPFYMVREVLPPSGT
ncbi:N-acetyltransferase [Massilia terrae]|uniref:GNAT family N-acetyltransferase n=1 Tax=Massilia terrae TaxID=1811224 RepID=A0ABT2CXR4_9BURK|nr:GNAT family N-acetyltransferase [Massilia terrae]MCS0658773.1 GNAT family N-acetyltransferase [Massilia terrae]